VLTAFLAARAFSGRSRPTGCTAACRNALPSHGIVQQGSARRSHWSDGGVESLHFPPFMQGSAGAGGNAGRDYADGYLGHDTSSSPRQGSVAQGMRLLAPVGCVRSVVSHKLLFWLLCTTFPRWWGKTSQQTTITLGPAASYAVCLHGARRGASSTSPRSARPSVKYVIGMS
jgi:hypothetical protein